MADFDSIENVLDEILRVLRKIDDKLDRIRGVGQFTADLHDLKTRLDEIERNTSK